MGREGSGRICFQRKSIRTQLIVYFGVFVVLPLCAGLMLLNVYLHSVMKENKVRHDSSSMLQIKDNADQIIEVANYSASTMMIDRDVLDDLRVINGSEDGYELYRAKTDLSGHISELESSVLNAVNGKMAILTDSGYLIGAHNLSMAQLDYRQQDWYQNVLANGRKVTFQTEISQLFREMQNYTVQDYQYLYIGRSIQDYSGRNLGILMIQLAATKIWGKYIQSMAVPDQGSLYILDENGKLLMEHRTEESLVQELAGEDGIRGASGNSIASGTMGNGYYYMAARLELSGNYLVYTIPERIFLEESVGVAKGILAMVIVLIILTVLTMIYFSERLSRPLIYVSELLENSENGILRIDNPDHSFLEMNKLISSYNRAGKRIEELIERVRVESHLKEKAHYEMLMSQISPHFIFNTVNSIRIMAGEEQDRRTERALESLGEILHAVYRNRNGMTTVGEETALLQAYVDIMRMRLGTSFQYLNAIPTELYFYKIPAFTLQPIVENAILHGVKDMKAGQIIVSAVEYPDDFVISVFNNGRCADRAMMEELLKNPKENKSRFTGIALSNINRRLKMLYGDSYGLIFNERVRAGFEIWVRIPKRGDDGQENDGTGEFGMQK